MEIKKVTDPSFKKYGKIIEGIDFSQILANLASSERKPKPGWIASAPDVIVALIMRLIFR